MDHVFRLISADRGKSAHLHQHSAVAVEREYLSVRIQGDAQRHAAGAAHGADLVEVLVAVVQREQFAARFAGGDDNAGTFRHLRQVAFQRLKACRSHPALRIVGQGAARRQNAGGFVQCLRRDRALGHDEGEGQVGLVHGFLRLGERACYLIFRLGEYGMRNTHCIQQFRGDRAHQFVLRFVRNAGLAAPGDDHHGWNAERMVERGQRVYGVAEARILAHHHRFA